VSVNEYHFTLDEHAGDAETLTQHLRDYNRLHAPDPLPPPEAPCSVQIFLRDARGAVMGGVLGRTHAIPFWLEITVVWLDEALRGHGWGRQLLEGAEEVGRRRQCRYARLATGHYQAAEFYAHLGYRLYGRLDDCPPGEVVFYYWKALSG
jgi:GNAT superfamily N-acetyltransferase